MSRIRLALCAALVCVFAAVPAAKTVRDAAATADEMAMREMLEGKDGRREMWASAPALVVISSVLDYEQGAMSTGFAALDQTMSEKELEQLEADLTDALYELTGGTFESFKSISVESAQPGEAVKVVRPGQIVVARYRGVQKKTGNIGYGGRLTHGESIVGAAVILDAAFDTKSNQRQLLRTHELGHALGYHHVESRPSVMNARVGSSITDFDRAAIRVAFDTPADHQTAPVEIASPQQMSNFRDYRADSFALARPENCNRLVFGLIHIAAQQCSLVRELQ